MRGVKIMEKNNNNVIELRLEESDLMGILEDKQITAEIEQELKKYHICLENGEYWKNKNYRIFLSKHINHKSYPLFNNLTYDYYIDKIILPQKGIDKSRFLGDFDVGNRNEAPERLQVGQLIQEIQNTVDLYLDPGKGKNGEDLYKGIYKKIYDTSDKGGLIKQFEEVSNINLSDFNDEYSRYKFIKLMYKFCKTKYYGEKINFPAMFKTVSFTNVDERLYNDDNNGTYIALLKNELLKEISLKSYVFFTWYFQLTLKSWFGINENAQDLLFNKKYILLEQLADEAEQFVKDNVLSEKCREQNKYKETLFETIYFWILQFEYRSFCGDIFNVSKHIHENNHNYRGYYVKGKDFFIKPPIKDFIQYYKNQFIKILVTADFNEKEVISLLKKCPKYIETFILWMKKYNMIQIDDKEPKELVLPSFLLASLLAMRDAIIYNEKAMCCYYRANKSGNMNLMSKISNSKRSENYFFHILWLKKISNIQMTILHSETALKNKTRVEKAVNDIMIYLFSFHNFTDFKAVNERLLQLAS